MGAISPFFHPRVLIMLTRKSPSAHPSRPIKTQRLVLREVTARDVPYMAELAGDWDIARMTARIPYPYSEALAHEWLATLGRDEVVRAVTRDGALIGAVGYLMNEDGSAEIGYWIGKPWWGHGYATEAASALVRYCFTTAGLKRLICCHFEDNPASQRVIEKLGFVPNGVCTAWCEARQADVATRSYEMRRPIAALFWRASP
jgi:RimJ/RimL family protein N-acetyltransferase